MSAVLTEARNLLVRAEAGPISSEYVDRLVSRATLCALIAIAEELQRQNESRELTPWQGHTNGGALK